LGGALFAYLYYRYRWRLGNALPTEWRAPSFRRRPKLRVHDPHDDPDDEQRPDSLESQLDDILRKIQEHGQDSLTRRERQLLERASREYQRRRR
jgi:hypothetical protein